MAEIGKRIRECREKMKMSQEELAQKLGYKNKSTIAKIEAGVNDIVQSKVVAFASALDTTPAYLMGWEDDTEDVSYKDAPSSPSTPEILTLYNSLDSEDQSLALGIVRQMAAQDKYKKYKKELSAG